MIQAYKGWALSTVGEEPFFVERHDGLPLLFDTKDIACSRIDFYKDTKLKSVLVEVEVRMIDDA